MRGLDLPALDRRLRPDSVAPLAVALSGGGDSLALLLAVRAWANAHGRRLLVLTVDHGLNPASGDWTERCRETAARFGLDFQALRWDGDKPASGLSAAARAARHALLADAARRAGAHVILMGHTADDLAEAEAMRAEGSTVGDPAEWSPSPAWPQGRGVFLLRPMLHLRREAIREHLRAQGETWIDDPANDDTRSARARARRGVLLPLREKVSAEPTDEGAPRHVPPPSSDLLRRPPSPAGGEGILILPRTAPAAAVAAGCLCAAGTDRPPRGDRLVRLVERLRSGETFAATLAGARIEATGEQALFMRDAGEAARGAMAALSLPQGEAVVWDGRFEIVADRPGLTVRPLAGLARRLSPSEQQALKAVPAAARPTLPVIVYGNDDPTCPILANSPPVRVSALALPRFEAATGVVDREPPV